MIDNQNETEEKKTDNGNLIGQIGEQLIDGFLTLLAAPFCCSGLYPF